MVLENKFLPNCTNESPCAQITGKRHTTEQIYLLKGQFKSVYSIELNPLIDMMFDSQWERTYRKTPI